MQPSSSEYLALQQRVSEIEAELSRLRDASVPLSYKGIRTLRVRERINLIEELWRSIWDKSPSKWFPLTPLIRGELEKRCEDGRL